MANSKETVIPWGCVFKITYPNKKIYVGSDTAKNAKADFFKYFGTPIRAKNEMLEDMQHYLSGEKPYNIKKEILFSKHDVKIGDILRIEQDFIKLLNAKDPKVGYNR